MKIINNIEKSIFRAYDIRGIYPEEINKEVSYTIGKSYGTNIKRLGKETCIVGHDNRTSSDELATSLINGILDTGINVIDIGLVTTPMMYFACIKLNIPSGMMITASHNPKEYNGFKFSFDERGNVRGEMIEEFRIFTEKGEFENGYGTYYKCDITESYIELFKKSLDFGPKRIKAVLDLGNGTTSIIARKIYESFPIDIEILYEESDGTFPNHHPDPCVEENLEALKKRVIETKADIGIGFDGDGDRFGMVDEKGTFILNDMYMAIIIRDIIDKVNNKSFLLDVKCSKALEDEILKLGGTPIWYRTGNSYTRAKIKTDHLPFGGELSGHVYFNDKFPGFDSGLYAGLRIIELLSKTEKKASDLLEGINKYYSTEELKFATTDDKKEEIVNKVKDYCVNKGYDIINIDGVRAKFSDGWSLVRSSNTGPNITTRFEADTEERLKEIQTEFTNLIESHIKDIKE